MCQIEEIPRSVPSAELFFGESVAQYLVELSDEACQSEAVAEGFLLGKHYRDELGCYGVISGVRQDRSTADSPVGWFRISETGTSVTQEDLSRIYSLFGYRKVYCIILDSAQGAMAMYSVEHGVARKVPSVMVENL